MQNTCEARFTFHDSPFTILKMPRMDGIDPLNIRKYGILIFNYVKGVSHNRILQHLKARNVNKFKGVKLHYATRPEQTDLNCGRGKGWICTSPPVKPNVWPSDGL